MSSSLQNLAPSAQRSVLVFGGLVGLAIVTYMFAVQPFKTSLAKARQVRDEAAMQKNIADKNLKEKDSVKASIQNVMTARKPYIDTLLEPLLESYAMRAKSYIEPIALECGLRGLDYEEMPLRFLPIPKPAPKQLYARYPIKVTCRGSYMAIASFVLRLERDMPLVSLGSFTILSQQDPDTQQAVLILEWPTKVLGGMK